MAEPDNVIWVVVAHKRFPFPSDNVIGNYPTATDANEAWNHLIVNAQWWTTYTVERRLK